MSTWLSPRSVWPIEALTHKYWHYLVNGGRLVDPATPETSLIARLQNTSPLCREHTAPTTSFSWILYKSWVILWYTVQWNYNTTNFLLQNLQKRHPIACPWGKDKGRLLWIQIQIYTLLQLLHWCRQYLVILDCVITAPNCICISWHRSCSIHIVIKKMP